MNGTAFTDFSDFVNHLLPHFKNRPAFEAAFEQQNYLVVDEWFGQNKYQVQGGKRIEGRVVLGHNGSARMVRPQQVTARNYTDNLKFFYANWVTCQGEVNYNEQIASNFSADTELADYMKSQFFVGVQSALALIENQGFAVPDNTDDDLNANGVPYWVNFADTGTTDYTGGFNGKTAIYGDGSTGTSVGGIDKSTETLWRNYTGNYSGSVDAQCLDMIERGLIFTDFQPPKDVAQYTQTRRPKRRIYWGLSQEAQYQRVRNQGSDPRNGDARPFSFNQRKLFSGVETAGMATLESALYSPIYVLDMPGFFPFVKTGWFMRKSKPMTDRDQHNDYVVYLDTQFNFGCSMPRRQAVYHTAF